MTYVGAGDPPPIFAGIDPDKGGGLAILCGKSRHILTLARTTLRKVGKRTDFDLVVMSDLVRNFLAAKDHPVSVRIEAAQPLPAKMGGLFANYWRGRAFALWEMALVAHRVRYDVVQPRRWKPLILDGVGVKDHEAMRAAARRLWPESESLFALKKDHGLAAAALIAEYGRRTG